MTEAVRVEASEAIEALRKAAWQEPAKGCPHCDHVCGPPGRWLVHTFSATGVGADWELESAIVLVRSADEVVWAPSFSGHNLVVTGGAPGRKRIISFGVPAPAEVLRRIQAEMDRLTSSMRERAAKTDRRADR